MLGARLRTLRQRHGLSQEQLAHKAQIPVNQVGRIERGEINPTVSTLYVLAQALGVEVKEMLGF